MMRLRTLRTLLSIALLVTAGHSVESYAQATQPCPVQGAWVMESQAVNGETQSLGQWRQLKILTDSHFAWVGQMSNPSIPQSEADSLETYRTQGFGGGPYEVSDSTYTEHLEYFSDPRYVGRDVTFSCRVEGDRWHIAGELPLLEAGEETGSMQLEEVWRRVGTAGQTGREE